MAELEPIDAQILDLVLRVLQHSSFKPNVFYAKRLVAEKLGMTEDNVDMPLRNLLRLGLIRPGVMGQGIVLDGHNVGAYKDIEMFGLTSLGQAFHDAVST